MEQSFKIREAKSPEILRAYERDCEFRAIFNFALREALEQVFDYRLLAKYNSEVNILEKFIYYWLTTLRGKQTLGEEYCQIQPCAMRHLNQQQVQNSVQNPQELFPWPPRRQIYVLLNLFLPYLVELKLKKVEQYLSNVARDLSGRLNQAIELK